MTQARRVVVVDDDPTARMRLIDLVAAERDFQLVGTCQDGVEAIARLRLGDVDLVFLDVDMPRKSGLEVIAEMGDEMPPVVFVTGFMQYAVRAFEACAIDFLLKPYDDARFHAALEKLREHLGVRDANNGTDPRIAELQQHLAAQGPKRDFPRRVLVRQGSVFEPVVLGDVEWISADGNYSVFHVGMKITIVAKSLAKLSDDVLDPDVFVRVHKSSVVNVQKIEKLKPNDHGDLTICLRSKLTVDCSRRYRDSLMRRIEATA